MPTPCPAGYQSLGPYSTAFLPNYCKAVTDSIIHPVQPAHTVCGCSFIKVFFNSVYLCHHPSKVHKVLNVSLKSFLMFPFFFSVSIYIFFLATYFGIPDTGSLDYSICQSVFVHSPQDGISQIPVPLGFLCFGS